MIKEGWDIHTFQVEHEAYEIVDDLLAMNMESVKIYCDD